MTSPTAAGCRDSSAEAIKSSCASYNTKKSLRAPPTAHRKTYALDERGRVFGVKNGGIVENRDETIIVRRCCGRRPTVWLKLNEQ